MICSKTFTIDEAVTPCADTCDRLEHFLAYWGFEDNLDDSGAGLRTLTATGSYQFNAGIAPMLKNVKLAPLVLYEGSVASLTRADDVDLRMVGTSFTIHFWVAMVFDHYVSRLPDICYQFNKKDASNGYFVSLTPFYGTPDAYGVVGGIMNGGVTKQVNGGTVLLPYAFHQIVMVVDTATNKLLMYVDGYLRNSTDITGFSVGSSLSQLSINNTPYGFKTTFDEAGLWNFAWTAEDVLCDWNSGVGRKYPCP